MRTAMAAINKNRGFTVLCIKNMTAVVQPWKFGSW